MIALEDFRALITAAYDGYGRAIKENQISVMHSQLRRFDRPALKYAVRKHCAESPRAPMISDILKYCGGTAVQGARTYDCDGCGEKFENVYTNPNNPKERLCVSCWYIQADTEGTSSLSAYAKSANQRISNLANSMMARPK